MRYVFAAVFAVGSVMALAQGLVAAGLVGLAYVAYLLIGDGRKWLIY